MAGPVNPAAPMTWPEERSTTARCAHRDSMK